VGLDVGTGVGFDVGLSVGLKVGLAVRLDVGFGIELAAPAWQATEVARSPKAKIARYRICVPPFDPQGAIHRA
jgi:hypothetical protein